MSNFKKPVEPNYYELLNISQDAGTDEIRNAYNQITRKFKVTKMASKSTLKYIEDEFSFYNDILNTLTDPKLRLEYDRELNYKGVNIKSDINNEINIIQTEPEKEFLSPVEEKLKFESAKQYIRQDNNEEAIEILKALSAANSKNAEYHSYLGYALLKKGWNGYAQSEFKIALNLNSNDILAKKYYKVPRQMEENSKGFIAKVIRLYHLLFKPTWQK